MLPNKPLRLSDIIHQSIKSWRQTLSSLSKLIGPLTVFKAVYATLFAQLLGLGANTPGSLLFLSLFIVVSIAFIEGCCFFAIQDAQKHQRSLSSLQVLIMFSRRGLVYLACWGLSMMLGALGAMLFIVPGILLFAYTKYAKLFALFEGLATMEAMSSSVQLVGKQVLRVITLDAVLVLISFTVLMLAQVITPILTNLFDMLIGDSGLGANIVNALGLFLTLLIVQIVVLPISINAQLLQWHDLKQRRRLNSKQDDEDEETEISLR